MTNPIEAWRIEHAYFNRLLALLQKQVDAFHFGENPKYDLMLDIISYLRDYSDKMHHLREDVAFARMAGHCPDLRSTLSRLAEDWEAVRNAVPHGSDPLFGGAGEDRYKVLRRQIALES